MSNLATAPLRARPTAPGRAAPSQRPHIEIVTTSAQRRTRPRAVYAVVTVGALFVIFAAQLLLSIVVSQGAYQIDSLQSQQKGLLRTQEALDEQFNLLNSTQHLAQNAASLGMVPNGSPRFLDLATGAVAGAPGTVDPTGCGGNCGLVANSLLTGVPLTTQATQKTETNSAGATAAKPPSEATVDALPAPVTH